MKTRQVECDKQEFDPETAISRLQPLLFAIGKEVLAMRESGAVAVTIKKGDFRDIVTLADTYSEETITAHIKRFYPGHRIRGEEGTDVRSRSVWEWIIDPLDGTTNFASGMDFFGISLGLYRDTIGQLGIIYFPALGKCMHTIKGKGAFVNGRRVVLQRTNTTLKGSLISVGLVPSTTNMYPLLREQVRNVLIGGSATAEVLWFIERKIDAYLHTGATPYDIAAARIIVEEAGGIASGIETDLINLNDEKIPVIFSGSSQLVQELRKILMGGT